MNDLRVALLIDADNLSGDVIDQAVEHLLKLYGAIHFRRAYSSPQKVIEHTDLFRRHSIRPMVNVPTGKNSTDIALAVDAIDLAICERPDVVVIGSSDSDYAPLAQRLREKGCRVIGIGQAGKTGGEAPLAYDEFIDLAHRKARETARPAPEARPPRVRV
ncbi:MAG: NYN domain-containing protein, partial [Rhizobiales bacterium]|nr:NYN domain-containing protein [Rhizobacter sp.]